MYMWMSSELPSPVESPGLVRGSNGRWQIVGGEGRLQALDSVWEFDGEEWTVREELLREPRASAVVVAVEAQSLEC